MRRPLALVLALLLPAVLAVGCTSARLTVGPEAFREHVAWLADDARKGRQTGTPEAEETAFYVSHEFAQAGLQPVPGPDWYQEFTALGERELAEGNELLVAGEAQELGEDWMPLPSAASGGSSAALAFAGYGITDPDGDYDDYAGLDVEGRIVVVLRHGPGASLESGPLRKRYAEGRGRQHVSFASKINTAFQQGASALLVVNDPATHPPGSAEDGVATFHRRGLGAVVSSLPAAQLSAQAGAALFTALGFDLASLQASIDGSGRPHSFLFEQSPVELTVATKRERVPAMNVVGWLAGSDPTLTRQHVIVGAHMDHLGLGDRSGSRAGADGVGRIHNGADDNASGTAGLIEIARAMAALEEPPARSVMFIAFGAEEWGLLGSRHYVEEPWLPLDDCVAMVNMDMIGRSGGRVTVQGLGTSPGFEELVRALNDEGPELELDLGADVPPNTDHAPFYEAGVPILSFFTGLHDDYHMPTDDLERVDAKNGAAVASLAGRAALHLANLDERPAFTRYEPPPRAEPTADPHEGQEVVGYGVSYGSQPDMTYQGDDGVRISGVRAGSPAEKSGLQAGDVIVALDGQDVRSLEDYSILLFSHRPGDEITVTVRRGEEIVELKAILEAPGAR